MSTPKAPPPPKRPPVSDAEKRSAADTVAAALGTGNGVTADTGAVSAAAVKERAAAKASEERVTATTPAVKTSPPAKKPAPPGKKAEEAAAEPDAAPPSEPVYPELAKAIEELNQVRSEVGTVADNLKKFSTETKKQFGDFREGMAALMETTKSVYDEVKAVQAMRPVGEEPEPRVVNHSVNHGHVRVLFSCLPDEPEWLEEWAEKNGEQFDVPTEELARLAQEFGFTVEETVDDYTGRLVCITYDEPTGV